MKHWYQEKRHDYPRIRRRPVSPMVFTEFVSEGKRYRTEQPLVFTVSYIEEDEVYLLEGEYHTILWGATREEAWDVLIDDFDWKWRHIAEADPEETGSLLRRHESGTQTAIQPGLTCPVRRGWFIGYYCERDFGRAIRGTAGTSTNS